jgi:UDP-GlcNAc:undecaprenyl-phosphate GlcNAc-1-phosphate transferase
MREYLLVLLVAALTTYLVTPWAEKWALRVGAVAEVRGRDIHTQRTPRLGGVAMYAGLLAGLLLASQLPMMKAVFANGEIVRALLSAASVLLVLGLVDDRWGLDAPTKLVGQVLAGSLLALQGITLIWLPALDRVLVLDPWTSVLLTVLLLVVTVNAINFVDGVDGLAAGITAIGALAFFVYSYFLSVEYGFVRATLPTLVSVLLVGVAVGFLPANFSKARSFMGDTGAMLLGLLLAVATIALTGQVDAAALANTTFFPAFMPILLPLAVLAVPLIDLISAVFRRVRAKRNPFAADQGHLHHQLLAHGNSQTRTVLVLYGFTATLAFGAVATAFVPVAWVLFVALISLALLGWFGFAAPKKVAVSR